MSKNRIYNNNVVNLYFFFLITILIIAVTYNVIPNASHQYTFSFFIKGIMAGFTQSDTFLLI